MNCGWTKSPCKRQRGNGLLSRRLSLQQRFRHWCPSLPPEAGVRSATFPATKQPEQKFLSKAKDGFKSPICSQPPLSPPARRIKFKFLSREYEALHNLAATFQTYVLPLSWQSRVMQIFLPFPKYSSTHLSFLVLFPLPGWTPTYLSKPKIVSFPIVSPRQSSVVSYIILFITQSYNYLLTTIVLQVVLDYSRDFINSGEWMDEVQSGCLKAGSCLLGHKRAACMLWGDLTNSLQSFGPFKD